LLDVQMRTPQSVARINSMPERYFLYDRKLAILPTRTSRGFQEVAMIKSIVGCSVVLCSGVLLMPWLVDTGTPVVAQEVRGTHHLVVTELASFPLAKLLNARVSAK
jgi:hypothetical protein